MVISKKIDYRKRKKRESFFGIPVAPLIIFLVLIIALLVIPSPQEISITGRVISGVFLTETEYESEDNFEGDIELNLYSQDLIPWNSSLVLKIESIKCNYFYVCENGEEIPWQTYDLSSQECEDVDDWPYYGGPWEECGETDLAMRECEDYNKECCASENSFGFFYANLNCDGNKECWDDCDSLSTSFLLRDAINTKSTTPWKGNYTYGNYNDANGTQIPGSGYGFSACRSNGYGSYPSTLAIYPITGQAAQQTQKPDLTVTQIYVQEDAGGSQPVILDTSGVYYQGGIKKVYAKIKNQGTADTSDFVVRACWYTKQPPSPSNCKIVTISLDVGEEYNFEIKTLTLIYNYNLLVEADYYNIIEESNEDNNNKTVYIGCKDPDLENIHSKGICEDINGEHTDYCKSRSELYEYICEPEFGSGVGISCYPKEITCSEGCNDGACNIPSSIHCFDSDGGKVYGKKGTCNDDQGSYTDFCIDEFDYLREYYCYQNEFCTFEDVLCEDGCERGECLEEEGKPDLVVVDIKRETIGGIEGLWITMKNIGTASTYGPKSFSIEVEYDFGGGQVEIREYILNNPGYEPNVEFGLPTNDVNIEGLAVDITAFVDSRDMVDELNEHNNILSEWLSPFTCDNWDNIYVFPLEDFDFETPNNPGFYNLIFSLEYGSLKIDSYSDEFEVVLEYTHMACHNYQCVAVSGSGNDQCVTNDDCGSACNENWIYGVWSICVSGQRQRECSDTNNCGTVYAKPSYCLPVGNKYMQIESCCDENWKCDEWSACYEHQGFMVQSMICKDLNECNSQNFTYTQLRDCCIEEWVCKWTPCINGKQEKICNDASACGTEFTKPALEIRDCKATLFPWWAWVLISIVLIAVIFVVLYVTKRIPKKQEQEGMEPSLRNYIRKATDSGMTKEQIKVKLIQRGWPENMIDRALNKL